MKPRPRIVVAACALALAACATAPAPDMSALMGARGAQAMDFEKLQGSMLAKQKLMQDLMNNPDLAAWHEQRERMALAIGDRTFDKGADRVFDSMIIALASIGCRVNNMERVSRFITASLPQLPPDQEDALRAEALQQYAQAKGYPPSVLQSQGAFDFDPGIGQNMMNRMAGLTLSMVPQGPKQTKVKLRFDNVYYPRTVDELYRKVWAAVDKQMFLDAALD